MLYFITWSWISCFFFINISWSIFVLTDADRYFFYWRLHGVSVLLEEIQQIGESVASILHWWHCHDEAIPRKSRGILLFDFTQFL
jgi:hypothetical protein